MKKRDLLLDFTTLLDVTLIIIFFFVLFSHLDSENNKERTEIKLNELEIAIQQAEKKESKADNLIAQLEKEIQFVNDYDERQASNIEEMIQYGKSGNVKLFLDLQESGWVTRVVCKKEVVAEIKSNANIGKEITTAIQNAGYNTNATIFCDFIFDGSLPGTASAYLMTKNGLEEVKKTYAFLYYSETDLSIGED